MRLAHFLFFLAPLSGLLKAADAPEASPTLVEIGTFLDYTVEQVAKKPIVTLRGTVSYVKAKGTSELVIEDSTGGVMLHWPDETILEAAREGQFVEVEGEAQSIWFSHRLSGIRLRILASSNPLIAQPANYMDLKSGRMECRLVETVGLVRSAKIDWQLEPPRLLLNILTPAGNFTAWVQLFHGADGSDFVDSEVKVRGVCLAWSNFRKQSSSLRLLVSKLSDVSMIGPAPRPAFEAPLATADTLFAFRRDGINLHRVRLHGVVTWCGTKESFTLQSGQYGISVRGDFGRSPLPVPGDEVEVAGFPELEGYSASLTDSVWQVIHSGKALPPLDTNASQIIGEQERQDVDQRLIRLEGMLVSRGSESDGALFELRDGSSRFEATLAGTQSVEFANSLRVGSVLSMTGICEILPKKPQDLRGPEPNRFVLRLRTSNDIKIVHSGPWLTIPRLLALCGAAALGLMGLLVWNRSLRITVDRRTKFLVNEVRSRHDRTVQFKAILCERERVAEELHDTVQQGLLATALQVEAASLTLTDHPAKTPQHLALAQRYLEHSREGLRRSVWNLHETPATADDIMIELEELIAAMNVEGGISIALHVEGAPRQLDELITHEIMRFARELISNAIRHSGGTRIVVAVNHDLRFFSLEVRDNGIGFNTAAAPGPSSGHFGVTGMRERANRLGAQLTLASQPGNGTVASVTLSLNKYEDTSIVS